jgi:molecular chaperone DnaK
MNADGILEVTASDKGTGKVQSIKIEASTGLSKEEIAKMKAEAEANADADKAAKEKVEKLNAADTLAFQTEKQLKEFGEKIPAEKKEPIEAALAELKEAQKTEDLAQIEAATEKLNTAWQAASQDIYAAQQEAQGGAGAGPEANPNDQANAGDAGSNGGAEDVTDVEFEEVDDAK